MEIEELVKKLRNCGGGTEGIKLVNEAADKIEWLQKLVDDSTNDHFVDTLDFYSEQCHRLFEQIADLQAMTTYISKKDFSNTLNDLKRNAEFFDKINDVLREFGDDSYVYSNRLENTVVDILETLFKDKESGWISYWIWECDFGETFNEGDVTEEDGTNVPLKTAEELYDFLVKNMRSKIND